MLPKRTPPKTTNLWALVDAMQRRLERLGMDDDAVDDTVTRGVHAVLTRRRQRGAARWLQPRSLMA